MKRTIKLTQSDGNLLYVEADSIIAVQGVGTNDSTNSASRVTTSYGKTYDVREKPNEVIDQIEAK